VDSETGRAETSIVGLALTAGTAIFEPALGVAKRRIGARLGSAATAGEGTQNLLYAYLAIAMFAGLAANALRFVVPVMAEVDCDDDTVTRVVVLPEEIRDDRDDRL
jgi:deoxyinosine 3'endonuclease (endonuclease V)